MTSRDILFTTETDGLPRHSVISEKYIHLFPNMLEFTMRRIGTYENLSLLLDHGIEVPEKITEINGITDELIAEHGVVPEGAANLICTLLMDGDCLVSHNVDFHIKVLKAFYFRMGKEFPKITTKCLQSSLIEDCAIPFDEEDPSKGFKKPSLDELKVKYNVPQQASKMDAMHFIYDSVGDKLIGEETIKPASF